jgi:hypothetical protein
MSTPPLLLGCALLFWGWQTGLLVLAVPTALLVEASRRVRWRLEFEQDHFNRLWNLSFLLALGLSFYLFFAQGGYSAVNDLVGTGPGSGGTRENSLRNVSNLLLRLVQCLPATMLLFLLAYAFGPVRTLPVSTFSLIYRRRAASPRQPGNQRFQDRRIDPAHGFLVLLLLAVSASNINPTWFFPALAALLAWTLWGLKSASVRPRWWITAMGVAIVLGFSSQLAVLHLQQLFEAWQNRLMQRLGNAREFDTTQTETSMGRLGELKQSGRIIWRVRSPATNPPGLLMEAAFNVYQQPSSTNTSGGFDPPSWTTRLRRFENSVDARRDADFQLNTNAFPVRSVTLTGYTRNGEVHIPYSSHRPAERFRDS